jgi:hypothetical protein
MPWHCFLARNISRARTFFGSIFGDRIEEILLSMGRTIGNLLLASEQELGNLKYFTW